MMEICSKLKLYQDILPAKSGLKRKALGPPKRKDAGSGVLSGGSLRTTGGSGGDASIAVRNEEC